MHTLLLIYIIGAIVSFVVFLTVSIVASSVVLNRLNHTKVKHKLFMAAVVLPVVVLKTVVWPLVVLKAALS